MYLHSFTMLKLRTYYITISVLVLIVTGCNRDSRGGTLKGDNVLLITLDTTRADRIGCYGYDKAVTPTLDSLAKSGTLFEQAFSQVNLTLPSHCSIMTGRYPREFGVHVNGRNALGTTHETLATQFKKHGYQTGAFVASFILDSRYGLDRGFEVYEDDMGEAPGLSDPMKWQIPGNMVTDRALKWLKSTKKKPFFCWVHYYDAHDPHMTPKGFDWKEPRPYDGEIAYMDMQLKRLMDWLSKNKLMDNTLVMVVADHGESFKEHGELGHTNFIYETNLHIPYIFSHPRLIPANQRIASIVETVDVFPTIHSLMGWELPAPLYSRSLTPALNKEDFESRPSYAESQYVFNSFGWAEQRSLTTKQWKYISSTKPELYNRQNDPGETKNLIDDKPEIAASMLDALKTRHNEIIPGVVEDSTIDTAALRVLETLGYTGTSAQSKEFLTPNLIDPKDMLDVMIKYSMAKEITEGSDIPDEHIMAAPLLESIVEDSPDSMIFHYTLGKCYLFSEEPELAYKSFKRALELDDTYIQSLISIGDALLMMEKPDEALEHFEIAYKLNEHNPEVCVRLAELKNKEGKPDEAIEFFRHAIEQMPTMMSAHVRLGDLLVKKNDYNGAVHHFQKAVDLKPEKFDNQFKLGTLLYHMGQFSQAIPYLQTAVQLQSNHGKALTNLAIALSQVGKTAESDKVFRQAIEIKEFASEAHFNYGIHLFNQQKAQQAIIQYKKSIELDPTLEPAYTELIGYYLSQKRHEDAVHTLKAAIQYVPGSVAFAHTLAKILSTCTEDHVRNGSEALQYANKAMELTGNKHPVILGTLTFAYAESGDFEKAIEIVDQAIQIAESNGKTKLAKSLQAQRQGYLEGRAHRIPQY